MRCHYLKILALLTGGGSLAQAQDLPATVEGQPHGWYLSPSIVMLQTQRFASNSPLLQSAANDPQPALGVRLGYSHSPVLALETGFHVLPNSSGFIAFAEPDFPRTYKSSQLYLPVALVYRVWQPAARLAVCAVVGGGMYLQNGFTPFTDTLRYSPVPGGPWNRKLLVNQQSTSRAPRYTAEWGLRMEWHVSQQFVIGGELKDLVAVSGTADNVISAADKTTRNVLATAHMAFRQHTLAAGINVRCVFQTGIRYRYRAK